MAQSIRIIHTPAHGLHAAKAATDHGGPHTDTERVHQHGLGFDPIAYPQLREISEGALDALARALGALGATISGAGFLPLMAAMIATSRCGYIDAQGLATVQAMRTGSARPEDSSTGSGKSICCGITIPTLS